MLPFVKQRKRRSAPTVGVAFGSGGVAAVAVRASGRDGPPRLVQAAHFPVADGEETAARLAQWVDENHLEKARAVGVIGDADYQVLQVEAPPVPATEMRRAAAWRVRDLIDFPLDQGVIDTYPVPESAHRGQTNINVVVARRAAVMERVEQIEGARLRVEAIDIPELAQRNVSTRLPESRGGHALLALDDAEGLITVYRDAEQFLARGLDTGLAALSFDADNAGESLLLEVQRSVDYFESALSEPPLGALHLYPAGDGVDELVRLFADNLSSIDVHAFDVADLVAVDIDPPHASALTLHALGAALREPGGAR